MTERQNDRNMVKNQEQCWEEQRQMIIKNIRCGKIVLDTEIVLADIDGITLLTRIDLIPMSTFIIDGTLKWIEGKKI